MGDNVVEFPLHRTTSTRDKAREYVLEWLVGYTKEVNKTIEHLGFGDEFRLILARVPKDWRSHDD